MNRTTTAASDSDAPPTDLSDPNDGITSAATEADSIVDTEELAQLLQPSAVPDEYARLDDEAEATIRRDGLTQFYGLRRMWSGWLIGWVSVLICFQILLTFSIGLGLLDYREYEWFLPLVTAQNFLQIVGMAIVVVRFLHSGAKKAADVESF